MARKVVVCGCGEGEAVTVEEMCTSILKGIAKQGDLSFVGVMEECGPAAKGDRLLELTPHFILWGGVSVELGGALNALRNEKLIDIKTTSVLCYIADGGMMNLPLAKRIPKSGLKSDKWVPVILTLTHKGKARVAEMERV